MKTYNLMVEIKLPDDLPFTQVKNYVRDAVECWGGQFSPDNPLFSANIRGNVKVANAKRLLDYVGKIPRTER